MAVSSWITHNSVRAAQFPYPGSDNKTPGIQAHYAQMVSLFGKRSREPLGFTRQLLLGACMFYSNCINRQGETHSRNASRAVRPVTIGNQAVIEIDLIDKVREGLICKSPNNSCCFSMALLVEADQKF